MRGDKQNQKVVKVWLFNLFVIFKTKQLFSVLDGPISDVVLLRTTTPLFQAYEEAFGQLESKACPAFHKSEEVSISVIYLFLYLFLSFSFSLSLLFLFFLSLFELQPVVLKNSWSVFQLVFSLRMRDSYTNPYESKQIE